MLFRSREANYVNGKVKDVSMIKINLRSIANVLEFLGKNKYRDKFIATVGEVLNGTLGLNEDVIVDVARVHVKIAEFDDGKVYSDERYTVCPFSLHSLGNLSDISDIRRQFYDKRLVVTGTHGLDHTRRPSTGYTKRHATLLDIRTGNVQLNGRNILQVIDACRTFSIIFWRRTTDIDNHIGVNVFDFRINMLTKIIHSLVLQPYAIQHTRGGF